ncbi:sugar transferase [Flavobacterium sp. HXWNR69]|uniref:Sugar transferase n=1 Tax=Flavobacterium fragile TaxID=2949085 RepID=A0ABT0TFW9_9FLAO|nr:sugar transferase [Flavobacterium sp. HXWNR69]MCL9769713.1 sugar transferase [Flavobacterium sp. HXWNR69]
MLFQQVRIGRYGVPFVIYKLRTIPVGATQPTAWGRFLRSTKLDELPQLVNLLKGDMALVGPRPDVPGYADLLQGEDRILLSLKPGITGLASLKYRNEEALLSQHDAPLLYNDTVIWPDKVRINVWYARHRTFWMDLKILFYTFFPFSFDVDLYISNYKDS